MAAGCPAPPDETGRLDGLLRFDPHTDARYEAEHGRERAVALCQIVLFGVAIYNVDNLTNLWLTPDLFALSVVCHLLVITPVSLVLAWLIRRVGPARREGLALLGMIGAAAVPILLFWLTTAPLGSYTFHTSVLAIVFGNMLLALRFRHALAFTGLAFVGAMLALATKSGLDPNLRLGLSVQFVTGGTFALYANYRMERQRCREYLRTLAARTASEAAESERERYQSLSHTDALTGLPNRRALDERVQDWLGDERAVALMMIDIDHFKPFNDTLGHPEGDACLRRVAALFATFVPETGMWPEILAARFGGEEFTVVLRDAGAPEAARCAAALVRAVEALAIPHPGRPDGTGVVTVSIGVALKDVGAARSRPALFTAADQALYRAKSRGRNGYALAEGGDPVGTRPSTTAVAKVA
ncbi:GGDEF domain-containing protein [Methylobacterium sp. SyP6R]|uniref:GGDEF domain-containing protein n=1 Tax=Methylobacterium sp. SyP6R TaxID=2718876 RepID=UPI001F44246A|nr:diguanylate cyclase [Methylobacterium sp. SyP6R]MCF4125824.1 diguanylate cyclase [Methylobacterium sp. SyP6R]